MLLCRYLKVLMEKTLEFISCRDVRQFDVEKSAAELREMFVDFHKCLEEYRHHESRELLLLEMSQQVRSLKALHDSLER